MDYRPTFQVGDWVAIKKRFTDQWALFDKGLEFGRVVSLSDSSYEDGATIAVVRWLGGDGRFTIWNEVHLESYSPSQEEIAEWITANLAR